MLLSPSLCELCRMRPSQAGVGLALGLQPHPPRQPAMAASSRPCPLTPVPPFACPRSFLSDLRSVWGQKARDTVAHFRDHGFGLPVASFLKSDSFRIFVPFPSLCPAGGQKQPLLLQPNQKPGDVERK